MGLLLAKLVYHCIPSTKSETNKIGAQYVPEKSNKVCVHADALFYTFFSTCYSLFCWFSFAEFYFSEYSTLRFPAEVRYTIWRSSSYPESLNCAFWITIHQNKFPQHPPHKALITEESLFYLWLSHFWPCFWSTGEPGLYLMCPFFLFYQTKGYFMQDFSLSRHL